MKHGSALRQWLRRERAEEHAGVYADAADPGRHDGQNLFGDVLPLLTRLIVDVPDCEPVTDTPSAKGTGRG